MHVRHDIPTLDAKGLRQFALVTGVILAALFGLVLPWLFGFGFRLWPWIIAVVLAIWGLVAPATLAPVYRAWMGFGLIMNRITTPLVLGFVFFLVITPVAFAMKLMRRDPMLRSLDLDSKSYRKASIKPSRNSMERPY